MTKALLCSDLHCSIKQLVRINELLQSEEGKDIALLLFCGDVVNMGEPVWVVEDLIRFLDKIALPFFWVPGNNDFGRAYYKLRAKYPSLEGKVVLIQTNKKNCHSELVSESEKIPDQARDDINITRRFTGVGGSPASWAGQYQGESMVDKKAIAGSIFLSHVPPPGVFNWQRKDLPILIQNSKLKSQNDNLKLEINELNENRKPVSPAGGLKIENSTGKRLKDAPVAHICGHVHHQWGCSYLGQTKLIKLASLETGHYAIMDLENLSVDFRRF